MAGPPFPMIASLPLYFAIISISALHQPFAPLQQGWTWNSCCLEAHHFLCRYLMGSEGSMPCKVAVPLASLLPHQGIPLPDSWLSSPGEGLLKYQGERTPCLGTPVYSSTFFCPVLLKTAHISAVKPQILKSG